MIVYILPCQDRNFEAQRSHRCLLLPLGKGYFMHFSTASAEPGDHAFLESPWLYPKPGAQCLQFFLHNTGATDDVLNIWVREYDEANPSGKLKLFKSISGNDERVNKTLHVVCVKIYIYV